MHPVRPGVLGPLWVLRRAEGGEGSVKWGCWGSVMSLADRSLSVETGEEGVGETECVVSKGSVGSVGVGGKVVVVMGTKGLRSAIHCRIC